MKRFTKVFLTGALVVCMMFTIQAPFAGEARAAAEYEFDTHKSATKQLKELFTTIDIMDATIAGLTDEMAAGNVTSEQITQMYIDRIRAYDSKKKLNSVISIDPAALDNARKLDEERKNGKVRGPLHGIPIIVKDNIDLAGTATSGGSLALANMVTGTDAFVVKKLKDAGAVIVAKANLSEFAASAVDSKSLLGGTVHNAYDISRVPAGSSGGTGVAITSNFATAGLGTDTGGSIRNPSSYSNLYGIRPSKGLTSINGIIPLAAPRDTVGPMARTAEDMAQVLEVMAGTDSKDTFTQEAGADKLVGSGYMSSLSADGLKGKRIGYLASSFDYNSMSTGDDEMDAKMEGPSDRIEEMEKRTRANLRKAGADFVDLSSDLSDIQIFIMGFGASDDTTEYDFNKYLHEKGNAAPYKTLKALYKSGKVGIYHTNLPVDEKSIDEMADSFETTPNPYKTKINGFMRDETWKIYLKARKTVMDIMKKKKIDAIMYIATLDIAPRYENIEEEFKINTIGWRYGFTFGPAMGLPEVVIPMGFSDPAGGVASQMPLGMRLFGKFGDEKTLMQISYAYEQQAGKEIRRMPATSPALEDHNLEAYLEALMDQVYSIDYSLYKEKPNGKIKLMKSAYARAAALDTKDPYVTYRAAKKLARAYDRVMKALKASGKKKTKTSFRVSVSKKNLKAKYGKNQTVKIKVRKLTKGSSKPVFKVRRVTNGQKSKVRIKAVKRTGTLKVKKKTKKCRIVVQVRSKANKKCTGKTKSVTIRVK